MLLNNLLFLISTQSKYNKTKCVCECCVIFSGEIEQLLRKQQNVSTKKKTSATERQLH